MPAADQEPQRYCSVCRYILDGLPGNRCPECGREFDPHDSSTYLDAKQIGRWYRFVRRVWAIISNPLCVVPFVWINTVTGTCLPVALGIAVVAVLRNAIRRRWVALAAIVLLSPPAFFFANAALEYTLGVGRLRWHGLFALEAYNIDPRYRCGKKSEGCLVTGGEWLTTGTYNATLKTFITVLGPMRGSYLGAYPTREESQAALEAGEDVSPEDILADRVRVGATTVKLDAGVGRELVRFSPWAEMREFPDLKQGKGEGLQIRGALFEDCLILNIPDCSPPNIPDGWGVLSDETPSGLTILIDTAVGRPFAYYRQGRRVSYCFSRVQWRR